MSSANSEMMELTVTSFGQSGSGLFSNLDSTTISPASATSANTQVHTSAVQLQLKMRGTPHQEVLGLR
jgi:hypothetical protein